MSNTYALALRQYQVAWYRKHYGITPVSNYRNGKVENVLIARDGHNSIV